MSIERRSTDRNVYKNQFYHDDDEVQPTPGVREIIAETQRQPLDQHLQKEYHREYPIHVIQNVL